MLLVAALVIGCGDGDRPSRTAEESDGRAARDVEILIRMALDRAVVTQRDVPDYDRLQTDGRIIVLNEVLVRVPTDSAAVRYPVGGAALPCSAGVQIVALPMEEIKDLASAGPLYYLRISSINIVGHDATCWVYTDRATPTGAPQFGFGHGYRQRFRRSGQGWVQVKEKTALEVFS
jgi:hypothetical protein